MKPERFMDKKLQPAQVLVLGFATVILLGAILLTLPLASRDGSSVGFINALFTATSAVCVTGLVVVDTGTHWTVFGQAVILGLIQIGGLGIMTMTTSVALIMGRKIGLRNRIIMSEALSQFSISGVVRLTRTIIVGTFMIEGVAAVILSLRFVPEFGVQKGIFFGVFHAVSAFCNAGFDLIGNFRSLTPYAGDLTINLVIMGLIVMGGIGFSVLIDIVNVRRFKDLSLHSRFALIVTGILLAVGFLLFLSLEFNNPATMGGSDFKTKTLSAMFLSVTPRTAGFNTVATDALRTPSLFLTIILMFIGGSPGSTAGGIKTTTFGLLVLMIFTTVRGREDVEFSYRRIERDVINRALVIFAIAIAVVLVVTFLMTITELGHSFIEIFFEVVSALGTVGLSMGITGSLTDIGKLLITLTMFFGRLGPLTIVVALARKQQDKHALIRYPQGKITVG